MSESSIRDDRSAREPLISASHSTSRTPEHETESQSGDADPSKLHVSMPAQVVNNNSINLPSKDLTKGTWYAAIRFHPFVRSRGREDLKLQPFLRRFGALNSTGALYVGRGYRPKNHTEEYVLTVSTRTRDFIPFYDRCTIMHVTDPDGKQRWQISGAGLSFNPMTKFRLALDKNEWLWLSTGSEVTLVARISNLRSELHFHIDLMEVLVADNKIVTERIVQR